MKKASITLVALLSLFCLVAGNCLAQDEPPSGADQRKWDEFFMRQALELARSSVRNGNYPFGAVLVKDGRVVVRAQNTVVSDKRLSHHAEINAIDTAFRDLGVKTLKGYTLYASGEPCSMCGGAIFLTEVSAVVYGAPQKFLDDLCPGYKGFGLTSMLNAPDQHVEVRGPVLRDAADRILSDYIEAKRRKRAK